MSSLLPPLDPACDLRSDALTQPTEEMWDAMRSHPLGWAPAGEDEAVLRLERLGAEASGKEACLFVPTGGMGNLVSLMSQTQRGDQVVLEASCHILWCEEWGFAYVCGVSPRAITTTDGALDPHDVEREITRTRFGFQSKTSLVCLENTHNGCGGTVLDASQIAAVAAVAHRNGAAVHVDGARVFNACAALGTDLHALVADADSVMFNLNKGLSAPGGALVCGSAEFIERCRVNVRRLGAENFHQAGIVAAAGIVALEQMADRLAEDNRRARRLAETVGSIRGVTVDLEKVRTNIVMAELDHDGPDAAAVAAYLRGRGIGAFPYTADVLRFVTHRHITDATVDRIGAAMEELFGPADPAAVDVPVDATA